MTKVLVFSDLDGCLLNKADYRFDDAKPTLARIAEAKILLILASSKTEPEMRRIATEMQLADAPLICENGGAVFWSNQTTDGAASPLVLGTPRSEILEVLAKLKQEFHFQSFEDLGVEGVAKSTNLPPDRAALALERSSTEPLTWLDDTDRIPSFRVQLETHGLTLTRGGRFWHVAGKTSKGVGMQQVCKRFDEQLDGSERHQTLAIGDSPIDQSMLDLADFPIGIPSPDGVVHVQANAQNGVIASKPGAAGWAESVSQVLDLLSL